MIYKILTEAIENNASDIHLGNNYYPSIRVDGELGALANYPICNEAMLRNFTQTILSIASNDDTRKGESSELFNTYLDQHYIDTSLEYNNNRFRVHIYRERGCDAHCLRLIPKDIPKISELNLPPVISTFARKQNGLILITGTTGSGKSTTLAALIDEINRNCKKHIITVEDPIEFVHNHNKSIINQREVGTDVHSFADAVKNAMREDPDILLVGELRDLDTIANAITMAETGHLVFGTLHTKNTAETIDRMIDVFPPIQQEQIRLQLSNCIEGIVSQELLPRISGGRIACCEILTVNDAIRNLIREQAGPNSILDQVSMNSKKTGSQTKTQALAKLVTRREISRETALQQTAHNDIDNLNRMIQLEGV